MTERVSVQEFLDHPAAVLRMAQHALVSIVDDAGRVVAILTVPRDKRPTHSEDK